MTDYELYEGYGCFDYCNTDRCNYYDPNKNLLQHYNTWLMGNNSNLGTIHILRQQKDWLGGLTQTGPYV